MITHDDFIYVTIDDPTELAIVRYVSRKMEIGGHSHIRRDRAERLEKLGEDQITGQACQMAFCKWWFGGIVEYTTHALAQVIRGRGDGGVDLPNRNLDVKGSLVRVNPTKEKQRDFLNYRLVVSAEEMHRDWIYVQALLVQSTEHMLQVALTGWAHTSMFASSPTPIIPDGKFNNCYLLDVYRLQPMTEVGINDYLRPIPEEPLDYHILKERLSSGVEGTRGQTVAFH